jgi:hypothetical protein
MRHRLWALGVVLAATVLHAQTLAPLSGPPPTGLVVGSGNFFSPIVGDLDKAAAFYRDGLGLDVQGARMKALGAPVVTKGWSTDRPARSALTV